MVFCSKEISILETNFHYYFCILFCGKIKFTILGKQFCGIKYIQLVI